MTGDMFFCDCSMGTCKEFVFFCHWKTWILFNGFDEFYVFANFLSSFSINFFFNLTVDRLKKTKTRIVFLARREMHACWWWWSENAEVVANTFFVEYIWTMACFPLLHGAQFYLEPCSLPTLTPPWLPVPAFFQIWDLLSSLSVSGHGITPVPPSKHRVPKSLCCNVQGSWRRMSCAVLELSYYLPVSQLPLPYNEAGEQNTLKLPSCFKVFI